MEHKLRGLTSMSRGQRILMLSLNKQLHNIPAVSVTVPPVGNEKRKTVYKRASLEQSHANAIDHDDDCRPIPCTGDESEDLACSCDGNPVDPTEAPAPKRARSMNDRDLRQTTKHPMLACCCCTRKCIEQINEVRRRQLHNDFWGLHYNARRAWIYSQIQRTEPKRKRKPETTSEHGRTYTGTYFMPDEHGTQKKVCKQFFLSTLGYKSDKLLTVLMSANTRPELTPKADMRGRHPPANKLSADTQNSIREHIQSYHPTVSHYRREHAPWRKYLAPELTVTDMYKDFRAKNGEISYQTYRRVLSSMNISFVKLGEEECEECMLYNNNHQHADSNATDDCADCVKWREHIERARVSHKRYQDDRALIHDDNTAVMSVDMQKVLMLPRLPGVKTCVFTRRLVAFHETFAPIGSVPKRPVVSALWHEGISGRNAEDLASVFIKVMQHLRDVRQFIFYVDNCGAQNKNWTLFTALTAVVNSDSGPDSVILRYLEKGHTFMSADSYHAKVESSLRKAKNVYDYNDFATVVERPGAKVINMEYNDFVLWKSGVSTAKFTKKPTLSDVHEVMFRRGSTKMFWKLNMDDDVYDEGEFLKKKTAQEHMSQLQSYESRTKPRGISSKKKDDLVAKLCPFMPSNRQVFWNSLTVDEDSADLIDNE